MAETTLIAESGRPAGSRPSRRLRAAGRVPAVVYGHGIGGLAVSVDGRELRHALSGVGGLNQLLSLVIGPETHLAVARSIQRHPVRHTVVHVDFQVVSRDEVISAEVPVVLAGDPKLVEQERGIVEHLVTSVTVHATPSLVPPQIEVDVSRLTVGSAVRVGDLELPPGVRVDAPGDEILVLASASRAAAAEGEPGEAGSSPEGTGAVPGASGGPGGAEEG